MNSLQKKKTDRGLLNQFLKFFIAGIINTVVDLGVLNLLTFLFNPSGSGYIFILCKTGSFIAAVSCSYLLNKNFVFTGRTGGSGKADARRERRKFLAVSIVGFAVNVSVASLSFFFLGKIFGKLLSLYILASASALCGSASSLFWNFFGYRRWVFKKKIIFPAQ